MVEPSAPPTAAAPAAAPLLTLETLQVYYGAIHALRGVSVTVRPGEIVTLIGANGAGKSTLLRAASGLVRPRSGRVVFDGEDVTRQNPAAVVSRGLVHCPEGRRIFANMSVRENLELGAYLRRDRAGIAADLEHALTLFPRLQERLSQNAGTLSGGEQQMLAIGRALLTKPKLLMLDEPSLGLAPNLVRDIFRIVETVNRDSGTAVLLVEQNALQALKVAHRGYVIETGRITLEGPCADLRANPDVKRAYLENDPLRLSEDNIADYADTLVLQARGGGVTLDYSEASVAVVERLLSVSDDLIHAETFPEAQRMLVVFYNGCYLGEVMARDLGGVWRFEENWYDSSLVFAYDDGGLQVHPFHKVHRRLMEPPADNDLVAYFDGLRRRLAGAA